MKPQSQYSRNRRDEIDLDELSNTELRALISGLAERKQSLTAGLSERRAQCAQCSHRGACGPRCQGG